MTPEEENRLKEEANRFTSDRMIKPQMEWDGSHFRYPASSLGFTVPPYEYPAYSWNYTILQPFDMSEEDRQSVIDAIEDVKQKAIIESLLDGLE